MYPIGHNKLFMYPYHREDRKRQKEELYDEVFFIKLVNDTRCRPLT